MAELFGRLPSVYSTNTPDGKVKNVLSDFPLGVHNEIVRRMTYLGRRRINEDTPRKVEICTPLKSEVVAAKLNGVNQHLRVYYRENQVHDTLVILHVGRASEEDVKIAEQRLHEDEEKTRHFLSELKKDPAERSARFFNRLADALVARWKGKDDAAMPVVKELQALYAAFELPYAHQDLRAQATQIVEAALDLQQADSSAEGHVAQEKLDKMLEPFDIQIKFGEEQEFDSEEASRIIEHLELETGRRKRRLLQYFTDSSGVSVLEARKDRINTRHLPPIRKILRDFARGAVDVQPTETGYPGIQKLSFFVEASEYWAFVIIDEADAVAILEIGGERVGGQAQEDFKRAVVNKIAHQKTVRAELERLQDRNGRNLYFSQAVTGLSQKLSDAADEITGVLYKLQRVTQIEIPHEEVQGVARDLARLYRDKNSQVNAEVLARWVAENLDTDIALPQSIRQDRL